MVTITIKDEKFALLPLDEYERLRRAAAGMSDVDLPAWPPKDAKGNMPAVAFARVSIARDIRIARRRLGLTQAKLAELAGVRAETISRIERGNHNAEPSTIEKIDRAITRAEAKMETKASRRTA